jgi:hypothetical protein
MLAVVRVEERNKQVNRGADHLLQQYLIQREWLQFLFFILRDNINRIITSHVRLPYVLYDGLGWFAHEFHHAWYKSYEAYVESQNAPKSGGLHVYS